MDSVVRWFRLLCAQQRKKSTFESPRSKRERDTPSIQMQSAEQQEVTRWICGPKSNGGIDTSRMFPMRSVKQVSVDDRETLPKSNPPHYSIDQRNISTRSRVSCQTCFSDGSFRHCKCDLHASARRLVLLLRLFLCRSAVAAAECY